MIRPMTIMRDQRGVALPLALIAMLILTTLVLTVLNLGAVEPQISGNLSDTARARHLAEAGVEWAFDCIADQDLSAFLPAPTMSRTRPTTSSPPAWQGRTSVPG